MDDDTATTRSSSCMLSTDHARSHLANTSLINSQDRSISIEHQQLLAKLIRMKNQKKKHSLSSAVIKTSVESTSTDVNDVSRQKIKRFKSSHRKIRQVNDRASRFFLSLSVDSRRISQHHSYFHLRIVYQLLATIYLCQQYGQYHNRLLNNYHQATLSIHRRQSSNN
jgi:hypothetical protein